VRRVVSMTADDTGGALDATADIAGRAAVSELAKRLADLFKADNPRFRCDCFFAACWLDSWGELVPNAMKRVWNGTRPHRRDWRTTQ
jgi:hypothetical protein